MNSKEAGKILAVLKGIYPAGYRSMSQDDNIVLIKSWARVFKDWEYELVSQAVDVVIATNKTNFPPSPGAVMDQLIKLNTQVEMTEMEAWQLVFKAIKRSGWYAREEFSKLPKAIQRSVGSPEMLKGWSEMPADKINSVVQSNFMRSFRNRKEQDRESLAIPESVKGDILKLSEGMGS